MGHSRFSAPHVFQAFWPRSLEQQQPVTKTQKKLLASMTVIWHHVLQGGDTSTNGETELPERPGSAMERLCHQ
jgi:hypothetical protein